MARIGFSVAAGIRRWTLNKLLKGAGPGAAPTEIDVPAGEAPTKEFFAPTGWGNDGATHMKSFYMPVWKLDAANEEVFIGFYVPHDFTSIIDAVVVFIPAATQDHRFEIYTLYGAAGEMLNTHGESLLDEDIAMTSLITHEFDISSLLPDLVASDYVAVTLLGTITNPPNVYVVGVRFKYS